MTQERKRILSITVERLSDTGDESTRFEGLTGTAQEWTPEDAVRYRGLCNGEWSYIGIRARAQVLLGPFGPIQIITSGGVWGIESDSDVPYLNDVAQEELASLKAELHAMGFSKRAIAAASKEALSSFLLAA